jgi:deferrochelatase/peroxidase EfeB
MSNALVTIIAPLNLNRLADAQAAIDAMGNPPNAAIKDALDRAGGTHFASMHAFSSADGARGYILLEYSADGTEAEASGRIIAAIGDGLRSVFLLASDWPEDGGLAAYVRAHQVKVGGGWSDNPGLVFAGTPGTTVQQIRDEARLSTKVSDILASQGGNMHALERVADVRAKLAADPECAFAMQPAAAETPFKAPALPAIIPSLLGAFVKTYLWPVVLLIAALALFVGVRSAYPWDRFWPGLEAFATGFGLGLLGATLVATVLVIVVGLIVYELLRRAEKTDWLEERVIEPTTNSEMFARENHYAQNHMISVTQRKPGPVRWFTARLVFWVIGELAKQYYPPGFLSDIGTIHFARWVTAPGSPDLIFLSNYGGSWESYLEDFITRAHDGLTGIWSNSIGFPRSENLFQKGATDGERFKRYARHSMVPTRFWYSAYPTLTTTVIRTNAQIRRGLSGTMTEDEAMLWLALFGSAARPVDKLASNEIQSLIFGGLKFMPYGTCVIFDLPDDVARARAWLRTIYPKIAFNDGRRLRANAVVTLALGARGLARLGLPTESLNTFPFAFVNGMTTPSRRDILGDFGENAPEKWRWGRTQPDVALLVYGISQHDVNGLVEMLTAEAQNAAATAPHVIPLKPIPHGGPRERGEGRRKRGVPSAAERHAKAEETPYEDKEEPFGFVDGISQPVIEGTYKSKRVADKIHLVKPGEFILGYPDNRDNLPPGPTLPATADPENRLPLVAPPSDFGRTVVETMRDVGFNGSFLVIRELEQDVDGFWTYCKEEAENLRQRSRLPAPYEVGPEFIAAKLIGRWRDGTSLVRHPYEPSGDERKRYERYLGSQEKEPTEPGDDKHPMMRTTTSPPAAHPIERAPKPTTRADNDFLFGEEDPEALRCPFGAHIRRANPRDSLDPGSQDQIDISNRHRIMRVGRQFEPAEGGNPGLLFMCLNGDIERQFEFLQQTWLRSPNFHGLACEKDPLLGDAEEGVCSYTVPTRDGPVRLGPMPRFVTTKGGGYFFLPGKRLVEYLGGVP